MRKQKESMFKGSGIIFRRYRVELAIFCMLFFMGFGIFSLAQENATSDHNIFFDTDQDGLSNEEEAAYGTDPNNTDTDHDSYTDGTEVSSGYDPLVPAPGDKIVQQPSSHTSGNDGQKNLTKKVSEDLVDLLNQQQSTEGGVTINDVNALIEETITEEVRFENLPPIDPKTIIVKKQNYKNLSKEKRIEREKEDAIEYLTTLSYILATNMPQKISSENDVALLIATAAADLENITSTHTRASYLISLAEKGEDIFGQLAKLDVPENLVDVHSKGMQMARYAISLKTAIAQDQTDPLGTIVTLSKVQGLLSLGMDFGKEINARFTALGITEIPLDL